MKLRDQLLLQKLACHTNKQARIDDAVVASNSLSLGRRALHYGTSPNREFKTGGEVMAYDGEILNSCGIVNVDFSRAEVVAVSGSGPNVCGHLLIFSPSAGGYYFHVAERHGYPRYMSDTQYRRYLRETNKRELRRRPLELPDPAGAYARMESLLAEKWAWGGVPNNCVSFVEEIISAGGGNWSSYSNCPSVAVADPLQDRIARFYQLMESEIYGIYGVSR